MKNVNDVLIVKNMLSLKSMMTRHTPGWKNKTLMLPDKSSINLGDKMDTFPRHYSNWQHNVRVCGSNVTFE